MTKRNILVVAESIDINDSSGTKGRVALIKNLKKAGYKIRVLHYTRKDINLEGIECIAIKERKFNLLYLLSGFRRVFLRHFKIDLFKKAEGRMGFSFSFFNDSNSIRRGVQVNYTNEDLVLTFSKGASFRPHHALLKIPELHKKWMAYVHDPYPFHNYPPPYNWTEPGHDKKDAFFKRVSECASFSVFPSKLLMEWMGQFYPNFLKTGLVIPHQNLDLEVEENAEFPDYFNPHKFNLLHAGNLMKPRNPSYLIKAYQEFLRLNPEAGENSSLLFLGTADYYTDLFKKECLRIPSLYCSFGYVPYETVSLLQKNCSVNIILESNTEISPFLPGKFPHCVYANRPILLLSPLKSEVRRLLGLDYNLASKQDDVQTLTNMISDLYNRWKSNPEQLRLDREDLMEYLGMEYLKNQFKSVFE